MRKADLRSYGSGSIRPGHRPGTFECRFNGRSKIIEASGSKEAEAKLRDWLRVLAKEEQRSSDTSFAQLFELTLTNLREEQRSDISTVERRFRLHINPALGHLDGAAIEKADISNYIGKRLKAGVQNSTVNRELAIIRRTLNLAYEAGKIPAALPIRTLTEKNIRQGFVEDEDYRRMLDALPEHVKLPWVIGFHTGLRKGALLRLQWAWVNWNLHVIAVPESITKNGRRHMIPIYGDMLPYLKLAWTTRNPQCPFMCQYRGKRLKSFRNAFECTREALGLPIIFHDLRRTAIRKMERAGIPRREAMQVSNHETESVYGRYAIAGERSAMEVGKRMNEYLQKEAERENLGINLGMRSPDDDGLPN